MSAAPSNRALQPLVKMVAAGVHDAATAAAVTVDGDGSSDEAASTEYLDRLALAKVVTKQSADWHTTHAHFQRVESLHQEWTALPSEEKRQAFTKQLKVESNRVIQQLQHILDPTVHPAVPDDALSSGAVLLPPPSAVAASSSASFQSLFAPLPSYDSLDVSCSILVDTTSNTATRRRALDTILELAPSDLLACPQWDALLPAVASCVLVVGGAEERPKPRKKQDAKARAGAHGRGDSSTDAAAEAHARFLLASRAVRALSDLYEAGENSPQAAEVVLQVIATLKLLVPTVVAAASATGSGGAQWMASLSSVPLSAAPTPSSSCATPPSTLLAVSSIFFHLSRLLTHGLHALVESWVYYEVEMVDRLHSGTFDLFALGLAQGPHEPLIWTMLTATDSRLTWLTKWTAQINGRRGWHTAAVRSGGGSQHVIDAAWAIVRGSFDAPLVVPNGEITGDSTAKETLDLSRVDVNALACTAAWAFLTEHLASLMPLAMFQCGLDTAETTPATATTTSASPLKQSHASSSHKGHVSRSHKAHSHKSHSHKKRSEASPKPTKQELREQAEAAITQHQAQMRTQCVEFAVHVLSHFALSFGPPSSTSSLVSTPSVTERARLTFISLSHRFVNHALISGSIEPTFTLISLIATIEALRDTTRTTSMDRSIVERLAVLTKASSRAAPSSATSSRGGGSSTLNKSRSQPGDVKAGPTHTSRSHKRNAMDTRKKSTMPLDDSLVAVDVSGDDAPLSFSIIQQSALTGIMGLLLAFARSSSSSRRFLAEFEPLPRSSFIDLICGWLGLASESTRSGAETRRCFVFTSTGTSTSSDPSALVLPSVVESMLLDLVRECTTVVDSPSPSNSSSTSLEVNHVAHLRNLAVRIQKLMRELPAQDSPSSSTATAAARDTNSTHPPHQQSEQIAKLMDLWLHWASHTNSLDALHESHPQLLAYCCARFCLLLRSHSPSSACLPWCSRCSVSSCPSSSPTSIVVSHLHIVQLHSTLSRLLRSEMALLGLVRAGLPHLLFEAVAKRLTEEDEQWTLAFELEEEQREPHDNLWSLRMLITLLRSRYCLQLLDGEVSLLSSSSSEALTASSFPTAPRPPLFLLLAHVVDQWLLQRSGFDDDDAPTSKDKGLVLPLVLPLVFPLPVAPSSSSSSLPASWHDPLKPFVLASSSDAQEVSLRLLCGMVDGPCGATAVTSLRRWWALDRELALSNGQDQPPQDQCTRWHERLMRALE